MPRVPASLFVAVLLSPSSSLAMQGERRDSRPDILLLMADQMRADAMGCDGNAVVKTPTLDRLAAGGCRFEHAYSSTPSCTPARAALLTGMSPWGHGLLGQHRLAERYPVELPRSLAQAGYATWAIGKNHFYPQRNTHGYGGVELDEAGRADTPDFVSDYTAWLGERAPGAETLTEGTGWNDYRASAYHLDESLHPTYWTADRAVRFIEDHDSDAPFFLKVSFHRPHSPYDPPERWLAPYRDAEIPEALEAEWSDSAHGRFHRPDAYGSARNNLGPETVRAARAAYYGSVSFLDEQVQRILDSLAERGRLDRTLILFCSDHGDMLGDHHLWRKTYAYEGSARIPMLLWWGSELDYGKRGQVRTEPVELRDVLPTFLEAGGVPVPERVEGRSLLSLARGDRAGWRDYIDLEHAVHFWKTNTWNALTDGKIKYVFHAFGGDEQLFDLERDAGETRDLSTDPAHAETLALWRGRLVQHLAPRGAPWVVDGELGRRRRKVTLGPNYPRSFKSVEAVASTGE